MTKPSIYHSQGYNCAEAIIKSYNEEFNTNIPIAMGSGMGTGMAVGSLCGAVNAAVLVAGFLKGREDNESPNEARKCAKEILKKVVDENIYQLKNIDRRRRTYRCILKRNPIWIKRQWSYSAFSSLTAKLIYLRQIFLTEIRESWRSQERLLHSLSCFFLTSLPQV